LLPNRPDRISKKHGEFITEHGVPDDWERLTEEDFKQLRVQVQFELSDDDKEKEMESLIQMGQFVIGGGSSGSSDPRGRAGAAAVKVEEPSAGEIVADKVEALKSTKDQTLQRMRTINIEVRRMWAQAQALQKETGKDSQTIFISECSALEKKSIRAIKVLERWAVDGETAIETQLVKLVHLTEECDKLFDEALDWGKKFKFTTMGSRSATSTGSKRRKTKVES
jgi:hypothetical protein